MARERIDLLAGENTYKELSTFTDLEEMNKTVRTYRETIKELKFREDVKDKLSKLIMILKKHSCKYLGVSFLTKRSISEIMGVSYKTVQRLVKRLVDLHMIQEHAMKRPTDMRQTSNAITIEPYIKEEESYKTPQKNAHKCPSSKTTAINLKTKHKTYKRLKERNDLHNNTNTRDNIKNAEFVAHWVSPRFANLASSYFDKSKDIEEFWKVVKQNNRPVNGEKLFTKSQEEKIGIAALQSLVMKYKKGVRIKKSLFSYFHGIVNKLMTKFYFDEEFMAC
ncbi:helix-turn-helix binding domain protein [Bacillus phage Vinny]|uniref:Helix-turn-helix binding domain protein n=1 Tax=Bacillus phage Vinny TaxID=1805955 RepID=A0A143FJN7_9CAUD|nr:helix-turn-helix binding domain protein [Bacillus phage Vinny]